jgi:thiamine biosynthesis protein ThiS
MKYTSHLILVKVNGEVVPQTNFAEAPVPDGAVVEAIHLIGGG